MTKPTTITIDDVVYVKASDAGDPTPMRIIVANRGWVFLGLATEDAAGNITLADANCIRRWGTDDKRPGLGYIAVNGPTEKTKLDPSGTVRIPAAAVVSSFDTAASLWK